MNAISARLFIALKSPLQRTLDTRARCADCGAVLVRRDYESYWDDDPTLARNFLVPECCERCAEDWAL